MVTLAPVHDDPIVNELCRSGPFTHLMKKFAVDDEGRKTRVNLDPRILTTLMCGLPETDYRKPGGYVPIMKTITKGAEEAIKCGWTFNDYLRLLDDRGCQIMHQFRTDARTFHKDNTRPRYRKEADVVNHLMSIWAFAYTTLADRKNPDRVAEIRAESDERLHAAEELLDELFTAYDACVERGLDTGFTFGKNDREVLKYYFAAGKAHGYYHPVMPVRGIAEELFGDENAYKRAFTSLKNLRSESGGAILKMIHRGRFTGQKASGDASVYQLSTTAVKEHIDRLRSLAGLPDLDETVVAPAPNIPHPAGNRKERRRKFPSRYDEVKQSLDEYLLEQAEALMPVRKDAATEDELFAMMCGEDLVKQHPLSANEISDRTAARRAEEHKAAMRARRLKVAKEYLKDRKKKSHNPSPHSWIDVRGEYRTDTGPAAGETREDVYAKIALDQGWDYADNWWRATGSRVQVVELDRLSDDEVITVMGDPDNFIASPVPDITFPGAHLLPADDRDEEIWFAEEAYRTDACNDTWDEEWEELRPGVYVVTWRAPKANKKISPPPE